MQTVYFPKTLKRSSMGKKVFSPASPVGVPKTSWASSFHEAGMFQVFCTCSSIRGL